MGDNLSLARSPTPWASATRRSRTRLSVT